MHVRLMILWFGKYARALVAPLCIKIAAVCRALAAGVLFAASGGA